jgi:phosphoglucomutase
MTEAEIRERAEEYVRMETDPQFREQVESLLADGSPDELTDRFYTDLEFGTGGLRGVIGGGYNRMNPYIVGRATQGLAQYVRTHGKSGSDGVPSAVIAHDSRRYSDSFALQTALVFAANGIRAYLFSALRPTPELSFAVRELGASCGVVITASHNPPEYNGYKVYWDDGAQIVAPHDKAIIDQVQNHVTEVARMEKEEALSKNMLVYIDKEMDNAYVEMVKSNVIRPELVSERGAEARIVYTPLHGTGAMMVERVLGELGMQITTVPEQREPDGEFPTVESPNPEEAAAMDMAVALGREHAADLVMGTDPDSDRLGIAVPDGEDYALVTGNQLGVLLVDYIFSSLAEKGELPARPAFITTIVTTTLQKKIAEHWGAEAYETLTGFKNIAAIMRSWDDDPSAPTYVMGDEESYGYLIGRRVRDKDAITAAVLTAEMTLYHRSQGRSLLERLNALYREFGYHNEKTISKYFHGQQGQEIMNGLMERLRTEPPRSIAGVDVTSVRDVKRGVTLDVENGTESQDVELPRSNVLQFFLADGSIVCARPSGTEPKIKFYALCNAAPGADLSDARNEVDGKIAGITTDIQRWIQEAES